ncbi:MAG: metallophosphoesterase, partial [Victivallales bacterium]|nr:metallophosphoesterase [Victivallales bacterium]
IAFVASAAQAPFAAKHHTEVAKLTEETLVPILLDEDWHFTSVPEDGNWQNGPVQGNVFQLKGQQLNLDQLTPEKKKAKDQLILYNVFQAQASGIAVLGAAADWWLEVFVNGELCFSTFDKGNGIDDFAPRINRFYIPVRKGKNLLAIRARRGAAPIWKFGCGNVAGLAPFAALKEGPWLTHPDQDGISVRFITQGEVPSGVEYRRKGETEWKVTWDEADGQIRLSDFHCVRISGLEPGKYEYRIVMLEPLDFKVAVHLPEVCNFTVVPKDNVTASFLFMADLQFPAEGQRSLLKAYFKATDAPNCDFVVFGGDIGNNFIFRRWLDIFLHETYNAKPEGMPVVPVRGNHELRGKEIGDYSRLLGMPDGKTYGVLRYGDTAFLVLDCLECGAPGERGASMLNVVADRLLERQKAFLEKALQSEKWTSARRRIVLAHSAPYSHNSGFITNNLKAMVDPWFAGKKPRSKVDLWLCGHIHRYRRGIPGKAEIASMSGKGKPISGENYIFPVFTVAGPNKAGDIQSSVVRVDLKQDGIVVRTYAPDGAMIEHIEFDAAGNCKEIKSVPHIK